MRILIIEDDPLIGDGLKSGLRLLGYAVDWFSSSREGDQAMGVVHYDAVVLDLGLPGEDGVSLLTRWRRAGHTLPVVILTAREAVESRIAGLDAGADDYVVKPYDVDELLARMRALIRRSAGRAEPVFEHEGITIDPQSHAAMVDGTPVALTAREWAVLEPLIARPGMIFSRAQLEEKLYSWKDSVSSNAVEVYIHGLRKKLGPNLIQNVRGVGYVIPKT